MQQRYITSLTIVIVVLERAKKDLSNQTKRMHLIDISGFSMENRSRFMTLVIYDGNAYGL